MRKILETKAFDLLGKSSYNFYLIHVGVIQLLIAKHISHNELVYFLLLNAISIVLYKIVEVPCHQALKKLGGFPRVTLATAKGAQITPQE